MQYKNFFAVRALLGSSFLSPSQSMGDHNRTQRAYKTKKNIIARQKLKKSTALPKFDLKKSLLDEKTRSISLLSILLKDI